MGLLDILVAVLLASQGQAAERNDRTPAALRSSEAKDFFQTTKVWRIHLEIPAKEFEAMEPTGGMRFPGMGGPGGLPGARRTAPEKSTEKPTEKRTDVHKGGGFGFEFPWVHAKLTEGGTTFENLGVRYKGNASYMTSARGLKRNLKLEFDHYSKKGRFHGLEEINLNAGVMDPTKGREALAYAIFRSAGVPAPRTTFAEVTLTVPGKYDKEFLGLYTVVEQMDKTFLKDRFKSSKGLLMKPENVRSADYLGVDWAQYKARYKPKREPSKAEAQRVIEFAKLVNKSEDEQFRKEIGTYLDVDEFLRFTAANALVAHLDSFSHFEYGHNYYLYLNSETNKFVYMPWDLDLSLAGFPMGANPDQQLDLSVTQPYAGEHKLIERLLAVQDVKARYHQILNELTATCFSKEQLLKDIEAIETATKELRGRETKAVAARKEGASGFGPGGGGGRGQSPDLRTFVEKRTESVAAQLAGKSKGYVLAKAVNPFGGRRPGAGQGGFPGGGPGGFAGRPGGLPGGPQGKQFVEADRAVVPEEAQRILDKAIQAHGGAEKLTKLTGTTWKAKGSFTGPMGATEFTEEIALQFPDKSRFDVNVGDQFRFVSVLNGDKGWAKFGDQAQEMDANTLPELKENLYADWVTTLAPLTDKAFTLTDVAESKVNDRPIVGFKVARKDHRDVTLYFDKESGLLAKRATKAKDLFQGGAEFNEELIYSDYKEVNGVKRPTKVKQLKDGKESMTSTLSDIKLAEKLDDKLFSKPE